ncbi:DnaJ domain-containing protein [Reyranella sp.]|uniref:DnaJ domain-containing protein n=1 Tax=Reyranella sp. TaxID=1929291 RepID=UPI003F72F234
MPALLLALLSFAAIALAIAWLLRANPSSLARVMRVIMVVLGGIGVGAMLIFGLRFLPGLLPELMGLAGIVITALIARAVRNRPSGGFSAPGAGQRTEVDTAFLKAWIDHASGDVGGTVLAGRFAGRTLDALTDADLLDLRTECAADADSLRVLEAYLDRRLGADWRNARSAPPPRGSGSDMSREEALAVLGLSEGATGEEIKAAHRRLIQRMHPDVGGSADLAARINRAKDVLLGG